MRQGVGFVVEFLCRNSLPVEGFQQDSGTEPYPSHGRSERVVMLCGRRLARGFLVALVSSRCVAAGYADTDAEAAKPQAAVAQKVDALLADVGL